MNMYRLTVDHRSAGGDPRIIGRASSRRGMGMIPHERHDPKFVAFKSVNIRVGCIAKPRGIFRDHIQHRLYVRRRAGDDAQDFTRRRLLLQRFLEFLEQPHVLDGDHRLVGEGFKQLDLRRGEGAYLDAPCVQ